jgi:hypothetical protein
MKIAFLHASSSRRVSRAIGCLATACLAGLLVEGCATTGPGSVDSEAIPLAEVIGQVTVAVDQFRKTEAARYAQLTTAVFNFQTVRGVGAELNVKPLFFGFGFAASREVTHTFTFTYSKPGPRLRVAAAQPKELTADLVDMIGRAAKSARGALDAAGLPLNQVDLSVQFAVRRSITAGATAPVVELVTLGGNLKASSDRTQSVKLTFTRK